MRPTRAGLGLLAASLGLLVAGRVLGITELFILAAVGLAAVALAVCATTLARIDLSIRRIATPNRLRAGTPARIDLAILNRARRRTPVLLANDQIQNRGGASVLLAPLGSEQTARLAYRLPTDRRGLVQVGPLDLSHGDPLGLTRRRIRAAGVISLTVHPQLVELAPLRAVGGQEPTGDRRRQRTLANAGDEFFALRPYVVGDELKRVNWRVSAGLQDDLVVRQEENPQTGRVTVILDRRTEAYSGDPDGFERSVSAALSALHSGFRGGDTLGFTTTAGSAMSEIRTRSELDAVDEQLAMIDTTSDASLVQRIEELNRPGRGGTMVVATGAPEPDLNQALARAQRTFGLVVVIVCVQGPAPSGQAVLIYDGRHDLADQWRRVIAPSAKGRR